MPRTPSPGKRPAEGAPPESPASPKRRSPSKPSRTASEPPPERSMSDAASDRRAESKSDEPVRSSALPTVPEGGNVMSHSAGPSTTSRPKDWNFEDWITLKRRVPGLLDHIYNYPLAFDHPIRPFWEQIRDATSEWLNDQNIKWTFVSCVNQREQHDILDSTATMLVVTEEPDPEKGLLLAHALFASLQEIARQSDSPEMISAVDALDIDIVDGVYGPLAADAPSMGKSLSAEHAQSGTFGGFVRIIHDDAQPIIAGITCHHVACPDTKDAVPGRYGGHPARLQQSPGDDDYRKALSDYEEQHQEVADYNAFVKENFAKGMDGEEIKRAWAAAQAEVAKAVLPNPQRTIGSVCISSGISCPDPKQACLDWALIWMQPNLLGRNELQHDRSRARVQLVDRDQVSATTVRHNFVKPGLGALLKGSAYRVHGCESGVSYGVCDGIKPNIKWLDGSGESSEMQITSGGEHSFIKSGDSGALVTNAFGQVTGIAVGGLRKKQKHSFSVPSHVTPIQVVVDDIRQRLAEKFGWKGIVVEFDV